MKKAYQAKIEEIVGEMSCPKKFRCAEAGFENMCKAEDYGHDRYLECLEDSPEDCPFALSFVNGFFCQCPLRVFVAQKLKV